MLSRAAGAAGASAAPGSTAIGSAAPGSTAIAAAALLTLPLLPATPSLPAALTPEAPGALFAQADGGQDGHAGHGAGAATDSGPPAWRMPPMSTTMPMLPGLAEATPKLAPYLPGAGVVPDSLPEAVFRKVRALEDGDTLRLRAGLVRREVGARTFVMYGYNGQYPGPLIRVPEDAEITVLFENALDLPSTVHWHGIRLENRFDGVPGLTQELVQPGDTFVYRVRFPDAGIYWYHPHHREDVQQDLGLYGNILVDAPEPGYFGPANREEFLMLDDILLDGRGIFPYGRGGPVQTLMGRFGNVMLVNGEPRYELEVRRGEVVRFYLTNVANTRTYNLHLGDAPLKLVAADVGRFQREERVESVVLAPAQRYVVEARFDEPGRVALTNRIQAIDHFRGEFYPHVDTLGVVRVREEPVPAAEDHAEAFRTLRENGAVSEEIDRYREHFDRPVDHELRLTVRVGDLNSTLVAIMSLDTLYVPPVEWNDAMPMMNYLSSSEDVTWVLRDPETGAENMDVEWTFRQGEVYKLRIHNERRSFHPMQHPIHLHGQRFLVLSRDGVENDNLAWKDTVVIPVGSTADLLLEASNPGEWMLHCHIAEHLEAGMHMAFTVEPVEGEPPPGGAEDPPD